MTLPAGARIEVHSGPDRFDRYQYAMMWQTANPSHCSFCGGNVGVDYPFGVRVLVCRSCGACGQTMPRGQLFHAQLPT